MSSGAKNAKMKFELENDVIDENELF